MIIISFELDCLDESVVLGYCNAKTIHLLKEDKIHIKKLITDWPKLHLEKELGIYIKNKEWGQIIVEKLNTLGFTTNFVDTLEPITRSPSISFSARTFSMILPNIYISDMFHSQNESLLHALHIQAIINVVPTLMESKFENDIGFHYLNIFEEDNHTADLKSYFPLCNAFIDRHSQYCGVLVHCAAGISRSASILIAYVMYKLRMGMKDAFQFVRERHPIADPNFSFYCQLQLYESEILS